MTRLMLDHFRRKVGILLLGAALELAVGWYAANRAASVFLEPLSVLQLQITLNTGVLLLQFDLQRGIARIISALPLTAKQIGRVWWLESVGIPALALSALLFLGAGMYHAMHPNLEFPLRLLARWSLFTLLWLGAAFLAVSPPLRGLYGSPWARAWNLALASVWVAMIGGSFILAFAPLVSPVKSAMLECAGVVLTVAGWLQAERIALGRANLRAGSLHYRNPRGRQCAPGGYGGVPLLMSATFIRTFLIALAMVTLATLMMAWQAHLKSWQQVTEFGGNMGLFFPFWFVIFIQLFPYLLQLRFLRTLPISTPGLAAVMVSIGILPLLALGAVLAAVAGVSGGSALAIVVVKSYALMIAPAALCIFFAVWRGVGVEAVGLLALTMISFQAGPILFQLYFHAQVPASLSCLAAAVSVMLSFLLTWMTLACGSQAYRPAAGVFAIGPWGVAR